MHDTLALTPPLISINPTGGYIVSFGERVFPRIHNVRRTGEVWVCDCGAKCEALQALQTHLKNGGRQAPDPLPPCPICGSSCLPDPTSFGTVHDPAWRCLLGGHHHQELARARRLAEGFKRNPWLFPPVKDAQGIVLHEGVRRTDIVTFEEAHAINQRIYATTGYNPAG